mmetsp:Transcript_12102/g.34649  ORF Transcript_12102/g.34649 Transcript_12102/m.34649 type:complete len:380 (+) Transcript_12102:118-1257(+)|eukprot:CAMPEP_0170230434 /NCGR_PEP_ID=MMETSP0116_2-20130129/14949_1 /TAXON_ID=400756 /ORGANISM="Durinskia baltica, Strain CSIRO CS-38" /LENGTH=379 /DNA_ID=CAMNT_0010481201 /DNA_START=18 /DNA_END=1157 /DNA_ORIENTATION=-
MGQTTSWCGARDRSLGGAGVTNVSLGACDPRATEIVRVDLMAHLGAREGIKDREGLVPSKAMRAALNAKASVEPAVRTQARMQRDTAASQYADERWKATKEEWERQVRQAIAIQDGAPRPPSADGGVATAEDISQERFREEERRAALAAFKLEAEEDARRQAEADHNAQDGPNEALEAMDRASDELEAHWKAIQEAARLPRCEEGGEEASEAAVEKASEDEDGLPLRAQDGDEEVEAAPASQNEEHSDERAAAVRVFLSRHGFREVNERRRRRMKSACPLHVAAELGDAAMVRHLLGERADPALRNSAGHTALEIAAKSGCGSGPRTEVVDVLEQAISGRGRCDEEVEGGDGAHEHADVAQPGDASESAAVASAALGVA